MVTGVEFNALERNDTGQYTCTATNSLPGRETGDLRATPVTIPLTVLGWYLEYLQHLRCGITHFWHFTEVPDVPTDFTNGTFGSRWVSLEWRLGFNGNSDLQYLRVHITSQSAGESRVLNIAVTTQDMNK